MSEYALAGASFWTINRLYRPALLKGQEMGRFNLGSTVIVLFPQGRVQWDPGIGPGSAVRVGARVGRPLQAPTAAAQSDISAPG